MRKIPTARQSAESYQAVKIESVQYQSGGKGSGFGFSKPTATKIGRAIIDKRAHDKAFDNPLVLVSIKDGVLVDRLGVLR